MRTPEIKGVARVPRPLGVLLCGAMLLPRIALAEEAGPLTLDGLLSQLAQRSPALRGRRAEVLAARERPAQARAFEDPMLMTELWQVPIGTGHVPLMFTLRQPIPWPGKLRARGTVAELGVPRAAAEVGTTGRELRLEAVRAYYDYRLAVRSLDVLNQNRQLLGTLVRSVDARYRVGRAELAELLKAQEEVASLDNDVLDVERQRDLAVTAINRLLDFPAEQPLGPPVTEPVLRPVADLPTLTALALRQRPEVQAAEAARAQAQAQVRSARVERAPDLAAWAGIMTMLGGNERTFTVGLQTSIPSFSLQRTNAAVREAHAQTDVQQAAVQAAQARVRGEVREALLRLETAGRHIRLHREALLPLSEQAVEASQASYQSGRINIILLLEAARALLVHRLDYERFFSEYAQRLGELGAAVGGPVPQAEAAPQRKGDVP